MSKHTIKGFIYYEKSDYRDEPEIGFSMYAPNAEVWPNRVAVCEQSIEVEIPDRFDPRPAMVANLKAEEERIRLAYLAKVKQIHDRINSLLALEMDVSDRKED